MKTLTITKARANLGKFLEAAQDGQDVGIICRGRVVALRPVEVFSDGYAWSEYGVTPAEASAAAKRINDEVEKDRKAGQIRAWTKRKPGAARH